MPGDGQKLGRASLTNKGVEMIEAKNYEAKIQWMVHSIQEAIEVLSKVDDKLISDKELVTEGLTNAVNVLTYLYGIES